MLASITIYIALTLFTTYVVSNEEEMDYYVDVMNKCLLEPERGNHGDRFDFWYYDKDANACKWMASRSQFGNANRFVSRVACLAFCEYKEQHPCMAVHCGHGATCIVVQRTKCRQNTIESTAMRDCPPDYAVCLFENYRYPPIPRNDEYKWVMPRRCRVELNTNTSPSNRTELIPRMLVQYRAVDRKCKGFYVFPPARAYLAGKSQEEGLRSLIEGKNAFFDLEVCMSTCAE